MAEKRREDLGSKARAIRQSILAAFPPGMPLPKFFGAGDTGETWTDCLDRSLEAGAISRDLIWDLAPEAIRGRLPLMMVACLDHCETEVAEQIYSTLMAVLTPIRDDGRSQSDFMMRFGPLTPEQIKSVIAFIKFMDGVANQADSDAEPVVDAIEPLERLLNIKSKS